MPLDAICLRAVLHELRPQLIGARIDKVQQPARDQIVLLLRGNLRLLLNAGANQPRIQLTNILRDNPAQPPMFCMLLRKHLVGARVLSIEQPDLERMVILTLQCTDEFGEISQKQLVLECMGRRSNLVLLDAQGRIVECLRRVDADLSATRQLCPAFSTICRRRSTSCRFYRRRRTPSPSRSAAATRSRLSTSGCSTITPAFRR